jgi:hypothetical protein
MPNAVVALRQRVAVMLSVLAAAYDAILGSARGLKASFRLCAGFARQAISENAPRTNQSLDCHNPSINPSILIKIKIADASRLETRR